MGRSKKSFIKESESKKSTSYCNDSSSKNSTAKKRAVLDETLKNLRNHKR